MFRGSVTFQARIQGYGLLRLPSIEFNPRKPGVKKVTIEGPQGDEICTTVYFGAVASPDDGWKQATKVHKKILDRIAFNYSLPIENGHITSSFVVLLHPQLGGPVVDKVRTVFPRREAAYFVVREAGYLKAELEQASPPGEQYYGLFRSARQSLSPAEEFLHLYHILLLLYKDSQGEDSQMEVDRFIESQEPKVRKTPSPHTGNMETVYTRLRNEFAHGRAGVNLDQTRAEMRDNLPGLVALTKRAIALHP